MFEIKSGILIFFSAFALTVILTALILPALKKLRVGQYILSYVAEHKAKSGTPTMGGLCFISAAIIIAAIWTKLKDREVNLCLAVGFSYMVVGFIDDFLKIKFKDNKGLRAWQKLAFQFTIAIIVSLFAYRNGMGEIFIPIVKKAFDLGLFYVPIASLLFVFFTNSVNLTDGLDGLAGSVSVAFFIILGIIIALERTAFFSNYSYSLLSFSLAGALCSFLIFNTNKASLFMGDTGSLSIGGFASAIGILSGNMLFVPFLGIMYMLSSITVILQVFYFKKTKKRIFLMSPIHHHFQMKGFSEAKITYAYFIITVIIGLFCILTLL